VADNDEVVSLPGYGSTKTTVLVHRWGWGHLQFFFVCLQDNFADYNFILLIAIFFSVPS